MIWTHMRLGIMASKMELPIAYLRHPKMGGFGWSMQCDFSTVVSLRGSVGILDSICSAMSYVVSHNLCISLERVLSVQYLYC
jgi:hypothetical protein